MKKTNFKNLDIVLVLVVIILLIFKFKDNFFKSQEAQPTTTTTNSPSSTPTPVATVWGGKEIVFFMRQQYVNYVPENNAEFEKKFGKPKDILALNGETFIKNSFVNSGFNIKLLIAHQDQVADIKEILKTREVNFAYISAIGYAMIKDQFKIKPIFELSKNRDSEKCFQEIHFFTSKESDQINSLKDLDNKIFTYNYEPGGKSIPGRNLFNHWLLPRMLILKAAPNSSTHFNTNYDNFIPKVITNKNSGAISIMALFHKDNGKPTYGELEAFEKKMGKPFLDRYKLIHETHYNIPCDLIVAIGEIPDEVINEFKVEIKNITNDPKGQRAFFLNSSFQKVFEVDVEKLNNYVNLVKSSQDFVLNHVPRAKPEIPSERKPQPKLDTGRKFRQGTM